MEQCSFFLLAVLRFDFWFQFPLNGRFSLLVCFRNFLASREVAIVSSLQGTTRDALETRVEIASVPVTFIDTAGIRKTTDAIEAEGVTRAKARLLRLNCVFNEQSLFTAVSICFLEYA